jgi:hypothetical protein
MSCHLVVCWYDGVGAVSNAIYGDAGNAIELHERKGEFNEW